jgi:alanyl-tRNA synthetase
MLTPGSRVKLRVDKDRRLQLMRMHTATHILLRATKQVLGFHVWQQGSELDPVISRLDISHYKPISEDELHRIERLTNQIVLENREVKIHYLTRTEAEQRYGFEIYQGGVVPGRVIRLVEIEGFDVQACGGLHVRRTGEIGLIKVLRVTRIQDGIYRLLYTAGISSLEKLWELESLVSRVSKALATQPENLERTASRIFEEWKTAKKRLNSFLDLLAQLLETGKIYRLEQLNQGELIRLIQKAPAEKLLIIGSNGLLAIKHPRLQELELLRDKKGFRKSNIFVGRISDAEVEAIEAWFKEALES